MNDDEIKSLTKSVALEDEVIDVARTERRRLWRKLPSGYRLMHNYDGSHTYSFPTLVIVAIFGMLVIVMLVLPAYTQVGGSFCQLQNGISYTCPGGDWHGNTTQMVEHDTNGYRNYYCPIDGRYLGEQPFWSPLPA